MSHHESAAKGPTGRMVDRMLFFSDAVFAIVLTLLALELRPPHQDMSHASVWGVIYAAREHLGPFVLSFVLVGGWWFIHMRATKKLIEFDWPTAIANMLFLFFIALMPFATSFFAAEVSPEAGLAIYWIALLGAALSMNLMFLIMTRGKARLMGGMSSAEWRFRLLQSIAPSVAFGFGIWAALRGYYQLSQNCWALIFVIMLAGRIFIREPKPERPAPKA